MVDRGDFESIEIRYYSSPSIFITKADIDKMVRAKDAIEQIAYALQIAKELTALNKKEVN